ncbi:DUF5131 family protein [Methylosinus sp. Sm6]|uniref:DUF5131 family protein n=1 Tax=Methylosinus sp. Sm6 TaxID=2866948 RepID=UPI001C98E747|nr:DUF5131 family protein [Methylosinus sp. Sm6]MBY6239854.1 phage Gp37/Gp68 family protein [Methylosinus sp. Sm6]
MAETSKIEWTDATVNFWWGCTKVSAACDHCYAETWARRFNGEHWGAGVARRRIKGARALLHRLDNDYAEWAADHACGPLPPLSGARRRVFCMSMGDLFDNEVPLEWFVEAWRTIVVCNRVNIIVVTKRLAMIEKRLEESGFSDWPQHAWLLTSVHDQASADRETPRLLGLKSKLGIRVVGLSIEPMLGAIDLRRIRLSTPDDTPECKFYWNALHNDPRLDWIIAGGESGPGARPSHPDWFRGLRDQCAGAGAPFFFKQHGEYVEVDGPRCRGGHGSRSDRGPGVFWLRPDGARIELADRAARSCSVWGADSLMKRVGKRRAGRLLDGREHNEFPWPRS